MFIPRQRQKPNKMYTIVGKTAKIWAKQHLYGDFRVSVFFFAYNDKEGFEESAVVVFEEDEGFVLQEETEIFRFARGKRIFRFARGKRIFRFARGKRIFFAF